MVESRFEGLQARVAQGGQRIVFHDDKSSRFNYEKLLVKDAEGTVLAAHMEAEGNRLRIVVDDTRAVYPVVIDPLATT